MNSKRNHVKYQRYILENSNENSHFSSNKNLLSDLAGNEASRNENVVNISLIGNRLDFHPHPNDDSPPSNDRCQTTINLFINDPHLVQQNWQYASPSQRRSKMRNEIILGKSIPNHTMMKNLLGDLGIKKFSSAPNMSYSKRNKSLEEIVSDKSIINVTTPFIKTPLRRTIRMDNVADDKRTTLLYVNDKRCGGDFQRKNIENIEEEDEEKEPIKEEINNCAAHRCDHSVVKVEQMELKQLPTIPTLSHQLKDPLKRFKRKPFTVPSSSKETSILYRDTIGTQFAPAEKLVQPRRISPSFRVRTQLVKDILKTDPEVMSMYHTRLMWNHKKLFEELRQTDFQKHLKESAEKVEFSDDRCKAEPVKDENENLKEEKLPPIQSRGTVDQIDKIQSSNILNRTNRRSMCSIESHGSYAEYKKSLIKKSDGTLCCRNIDCSDDDVWSKSETRNIITSEFIRDKIKKFDRLTNRKGQNRTYLFDDKEIQEGINIMKHIQHRNTKSGNGHEDVSPSTRFSDETNISKMRYIKKIESGVLRGSSLGHSKPNREYVDMNERRCWPGVAERVRARPEENTMPWS